MPENGGNTQTLVSNRKLQGVVKINLASLPAA
jgi:hypothetical protein